MAAATQGEAGMAIDRTGRLRADCVAQALAIVAQEGVEKLSLREVARRLGVSHQAPYKHFPSRDHILAEIVASAFADFARHLDSCARSAQPDEDMHLMGRAYLAYALDHPLNYRLMFGTPLPDPDQHPRMMAEARHAFDLLKDMLRRSHIASGRAADDDSVTLDGMFVWATLHGLSGILGGNARQELGLSPQAVSATPEHVLSRIGQALAAGGEARDD